MLKIKSLKDEISAAGLFEGCEARTWGKFILMMSVIVALLVAHVQLSFWASALLIPITGALCAVTAMLGHEGSHRGLSKSSWRNRLLFNMTFPVLGGASGLYWHWKHDVRHHAYPNVVDVDPDILLWPMASTAEEYRRSSPGRQWFQRNFQGLFFWPLCFMLLWSIRGSSIDYLYRYAKEKGMDRAWLIDVACLSLHLAGWVVIPMVVFGPWALALYAGIWTVAGGVLSLVFAPAHIGMPIVTDPKDILRLQFETTRNLTMPKWLSFFFIGLDHQIEHHLFTKISHQRLEEVAVITKAWAARNGVAYHEISYWEGLKDVTRFIRDAWSMEPKELVQIASSSENKLVDAA